MPLVQDPVQIASVNPEVKAFELFLIYTIRNQSQ